MNEAAPQYLCLACGFRIFNRRYPRCEACGQDLPQALLLGSAERKALDAEHEKSRQDRKRIEQARRRRKSGNIADVPISYGDFGAADFVGGSGGDGGGGDGSGSGDCGHH